MFGEKLMTLTSVHYVLNDRKRIDFAFEGFVKLVKITDQSVHGHPSGE